MPALSRETQLGNRIDNVAGADHNHQVTGAHCLPRLLQLSGNISPNQTTLGRILP